MPHFTTLQEAAGPPAAQAAARSGRSTRRWRGAAAPSCCRRGCGWPGTPDASGFESRHASRYFLKKRMGCHRWDGHPERRYARHPKLALACDCATHVILSCADGPRAAADGPHFARPPLPLLPAAARGRVRAPVADAGFDAEAAHALAREVLGVRSAIPPLRARPTANLPGGRWRRLVRRRSPARVL